MALDLFKLTDLVTNQAYKQTLDPSGFITDGVASWNIDKNSELGRLITQGGYSGQLLKSTTSNEYVLLDRGSTDFWSNWFGTDLFGIALGTIGLGVDTYQMQAARAYATDQFE